MYLASLSSYYMQPEIYIAPKSGHEGLSRQPPMPMYTDRMIDVSIVIRAYNEAAQLEHLLTLIEGQQYDGHIEIIVVDNGSADDTPTVARRHGAKVVTLPQENFSYPKSLNIGIAAAHSPIVICTVAHAFPVSQRWISCAVRHFDDSRVVGVFSYSRSSKDGSIYDKLFDIGYWQTKLVGPTCVKWVHMGVFGAVNIAMRRSVWDGHKFDERYGAGGEDTAWAEWAISTGYKVIRDPDFVVRHSHNLRTFRQLWSQYKQWDSLKQPRPFEPSELSFRHITRDRG
jgi:glycosyltransferase involved in cell wall biosynthesis